MKTQVQVALIQPSSPIYAKVADWRKRYLHSVKVCLAFSAALGAVSYRSHPAYPISAFTFSEKKKVPFGWVECKFRTRIHAYAPPRSNKKLWAEIEALPRQPDPHELADLIGIPTGAHYKCGKSDCYTTITPDGRWDPVKAHWVTAKGPIYLSFTNLAEWEKAEQGGRRGVMKFKGDRPSDWKPPAGLVYMTEAEYDLAVATEKVALERKGKRA